MGVSVQATLINIAKTHAIFGEGTRVKVIKVRFGLFIHVFYVFMQPGCRSGVDTGPGNSATCVCMLWGWQRDLNLAGLQL